VYDRTLLDRLNRIDEAITIAAVPPFAPVEPRQMVATIKIIPFAVREDPLARYTAAVAEAGGLFRVARYLPHRVGLVQTTLPGTREKVLEKTVDILRGRVESVAGTLAGETRCRHEVSALSREIGAWLSERCTMVLVSGASAITDRRDVVPAAIEAAGGTVEHFGMPVDPGNLMLLARCGDVPVVGLPGCVRSPKLNGFDWVLQRLAVGLEVGAADIMAMGAGGLLTEIPARPLPRAEAGAPPAVARAPRIAAVVLAAGQSRRMGPQNKMLATVDGEPMIARVVDNVLASQARPVVVVTGYESARVREALAGRPVELVDNPRFAEGLSFSLRCGLRALPPDIEGALICLGDMPRVTPDQLDRLIAAFNPVEGRAICVPTVQGKRGNPVLFARRFFEAMETVSGDVGARHLIGEAPDLVCEVEMADRGVLLDIDTPAALSGLTG
ncbi:MAG TPA: 4-diphosphocytidyl-2C-methyl-D-erythritol kinase, partial [Alphaproteobacteria bacterium]|nr:4-diphosphocytidyl-2C-methyl-D-erythritol kinase [Alphaproteobacteria bacterium]